MRTTYSGLVDEKLIGQTVTLYGWAHRRRDHGGVIFIDLRDREGLVQVVCDPDRPEVFATADKVRNEFCLAVVGVVRARPEGTKNEHLISGGVEVLCQQLEILNPARRRHRERIGSPYLSRARSASSADAAQPQAALQSGSGLSSLP